MTLLQSAWQVLDNNMLSYIESHGTGTLLGDPIEITAMGNAFRGVKSQTSPPLRTASLKSNIGHLECAAGASSTLKLSLILQQACIPASLHFHVPNSHIDWQSCHVDVVGDLQPLAQQGQPSNEKQFAGVSGFGFGGTNGHIVLQTTDSKAHAVARRGMDSLRSVVFSDCNIDSLQESVCRMSAWLDKVLPGHDAKLPAHLAHSLDICGVASTAAQRVKGLACTGRIRAALLASSLQELQEQLPGLLESLKAEGARKAPASTPRVAFFLNGTSQPRAFTALNTLQRMASKSSSWGDLSACLQQMKLNEKNADAATCAALFAAAIALQADLGISLSAVIGHGYAGEAAALCISGVLSFQDAVASFANEGRGPEAYAWPPLVPMFSSHVGGQLVEEPGSDHWKDLFVSRFRGPHLAGVIKAAQAVACDLIVEVCVAEPISDSISTYHECGEGDTRTYEAPMPQFAIASLDPGDGSVSTTDYTARSLVGVAASIFSLGGNPDLSKFTGASSKARLPPRGSAPVPCWPPNQKSGRVLSNDFDPQIPEAVDRNRFTSHINCAGPSMDIHRLQAQVADLERKLLSREEQIARLEQTRGYEGDAREELIKGVSADSMLSEYGRRNNLHLEEIVREAVCIVIPAVLPFYFNMEAELVEEVLDSLSAIEL
jgi:hypothetical protein